MLSANPDSYRDTGFTRIGSWTRNTLGQKPRRFIGEPLKKSKSE
jgi:hypothetical protein